MLLDFHPLLLSLRLLARPRPHLTPRHPLPFCALVRLHRLRNVSPVLSSLPSRAFPALDSSLVDGGRTYPRNLVLAYNFRRNEDSHVVLPLAEDIISSD